MTPTREELIWALCEVLDGQGQAHEVVRDTGLRLSQAQRVLAIRDSVKAIWLEQGEPPVPGRASEAFLDLPPRPPDSAQFTI